MVSGSIELTNCLHLWFEFAHGDDMTGTVAHLFIKTGPRIPMTPKTQIELLAGKGIHGDHSFGRTRRQILLVDLKVVNSYSLQPGSLRENLTVSEIDLTSFQKGDILIVGQCRLEVVGDCTPCSRVDEIRDGLQSEIEGERGILARVVQGGKVQIGDPISKLME